ncbi:MAG: trypsin-like peptidase domain-containing protein [Phycisphaerae bacterium]|nr:trypsin-like peptidase domain-containing protein [Phycisphaerae bacterium]
MLLLTRAFVVATSLAMIASVPPSTSSVATPALAGTFEAIDAARRATYEGTARSIVSVTTYVKVRDGTPRVGRWQEADDSPHSGYVLYSASSGIVVGVDGTVLCCRSPLTTTDSGFVELIDVETADGTRVAADLLASEPTINLAVLRVKAADARALPEMVPAAIGKVEELQPGETIFAIGDSPGSARTFAPGVVMALPNAACYQADLTGSFIHASMAVAPAAIGGALVNGRGEFVGMIVPPPSVDPTERIEPRTYVTFAMQMQTALGVGEVLQKKRTNESPWLGFSVLSQDELRAKLHDDAKFNAIAKPSFGLFIDDIYEPSPASRAGVRRGDFVVEINGGQITSVVDFQQALYYYSGTAVPIKFVRDGETTQRLVTIERRPVEANRN